MDFEKNGYVVLKGVLPEKVADFVFKYFLMKRKVADLFFRSKYIPVDSPEWGTWADSQVPGTYSVYGDIAMETILHEIKPIMENITRKKLYETYSYARIYKKGDLLYRHKDRFSCEISTTLNLGGDPWPIYIDPTGEDNVIETETTDKGYKPTLKSSAHKGVEVDLKPGDMLVYKGNLLEHWRNEFEGQNCAQVFLHYNDVNTPGAEKNKYDGRVTLGIPSKFDFNV